MVPVAGVGVIVAEISTVSEYNFTDGTTILIFISPPVALNESVAGLNFTA